MENQFKLWEKKITTQYSFKVPEFLADNPEKKEEILNILSKWVNVMNITKLESIRPETELIIYKYEVDNKTWNKKNLWPIETTVGDIIANFEDNTGGKYQAKTAA